MTSATPLDLSAGGESAPAGHRPQLKQIRLLSAREKISLVAFFGRLAVKEHLIPTLAVRPLVAELFLTDNCNLRCVTCACWKSHTRRELSTLEWRDVINQLVELRILKANFTGGEPLLRRDAVDLMGYASAAGIRSLHLNTNAILLTKARREAVLRAGVRSFNISIDGPDGDIHDVIRGRRGSFDTTVSNLSALLEDGKSTPLRVRLMYTVQRRNAQYLPAIGRLAQDLGVQLYLNLATDRTFLFRHEDVGPETEVDEDALRKAVEELDRLASERRSWLPRPSERRYVLDHFRDVLQPGLPCAESQLKLLIHSTGEIGGCWAHDGRHNVRANRIADVLRSDEYKKDHDRFFRKECVGCGSNYSLNLRWRPRTYFADVRAYAGSWSSKHLKAARGS